MSATDSLDYAFLRYFGVNAAVEERFHSFYLKYLSDYHRVLDLGSGMGGFVQLLEKSGKNAYGVDSDPGCVAEARGLGVEIVEADVVEYLRTLEEGSLDAIFSAHLVEHLPYEVVLEVIRLSHRALRPGGRLLLVTPNPRGLISHLEFYHQHFGHVAFYQPELLAFFMNYAGFQRTQTGENPDTSPDQVAPGHPLGRITAPPPKPLTHLDILPCPTNFWRRLVWYPKAWLARWLVRPYTDQLMSRLTQAEQRLADYASALNRPFECYAIGDKALTATDSTTRQHL